MTKLRLSAPSRLHFGLLSWGDSVSRRFGGLGLMIENPGLELTAQLATHWEAEGPLSGRALRIAATIEERLNREQGPIQPLRLQIHSAPPEHVGLGTGTQLSLAIAKCVAAVAGRAELPIETLAQWTGRGSRSGIGLHGFVSGGMLVDGGRPRDHAGTVPPRLCRLEFPEEWSVLVVVPSASPGLCGADEIRAFQELPPFPESLIDRLCRLVLLGLLPSVIERDLPDFGLALEEIQDRVGRAFAPAQHGLFAHPVSAEIVSFLRTAGLHGVGQSSWGPTLYGFLHCQHPQRHAIREQVLERFPIDPTRVFWTRASRTGCRSRLLTPPSDEGTA